MDAGKTLRDIAGFPAELVEIEIPTSVAGGDTSPDTVGLFQVAELERLVDRQALLRGDIGVEPPYWALVWIGARALAGRLLADPPAPGTRVLDLGCGLGLPGIVAGRRGCSVTFADLAGEALEFARVNVEHHRLTDCRILRVDFTRDRLDETFDLILAADIVYEREHYGSLVEFLDRHVRDQGTILLTESLRADARNVVHMLETKGYARRTQPVWVNEAGKPERTWLHTLVAPPGRYFA